MCTVCQFSIYQAQPGRGVANQSQLNNIRSDDPPCIMKENCLRTAYFVSGTNFLKHAINEYNRETLKWTPLSDERREGGSGDEEHTPHLRTHLEEPSHLQLHRENVSYAKGSGVVSLIWAIIEYWLNSSINVILWQFSLANIWFRNFVRLTNIGHGISIEAMFFAFPGA